MKRILKHLIILKIKILIILAIMTNQTVFAPNNQNITMPTNSVIAYTAAKNKASDISTTKQLYDRLIMLNCSHPEHTLAQAILESNWKLNSNLAEENNNLFGMRIARQRPTTNIAKSGSWAKYESKEKSVIDILIWQSYTGLRKGNDFMQHLKVKGYCNSSTYTFDLQCIMDSMEFKEITKH